MRAFIQSKLGKVIILLCIVSIVISLVVSGPCDGPIDEVFNGVRDKTGCKAEHGYFTQTNSSWYSDTKLLTIVSGILIVVSVIIYNVTLYLKKLNAIRKSNNENR